MTPRFLVWAANWVGHKLQEQNTEISSRQLDNMGPELSSDLYGDKFYFQYVGDNGSHGHIGDH